MKGHVASEEGQDVLRRLVEAWLEGLGCRDVYRGISWVVGIHCLCIISPTMENQMEKKIWRMKWTVGFGLVALGFLQIKGTIVGGSL